MTRTAQMQAVLIYKVSDRGTWARAQDTGAFAGSPDDQRDGFIHFSSARQLAGTLAKYYASRDDLVLAAVDPARLGAALRWEPARGGERFPHLYQPLAMADVAWVHDLALGTDGRHVLPADVALELAVTEGPVTRC